VLLESVTPKSFRPSALALVFATSIGCAIRSGVDELEILSSAQAVFDPPLVWGPLQAGPHAVGFHQELAIDRTRGYPMLLGEKPAGRPVLLDVWYPARNDDKPQLTFGRYLEVKAQAPALAVFRTRMERYLRDVAVQETLWREASYLSPRAADAFAALLSEPVAAREDVPAASGRFPLVLVHAGLGGALADNFVLYEYLASLGYVVIASAFQPDDGHSMSIDWNVMVSTQDLAFAWGYGLNLPYADRERIAVLGHSYGAQAALAFAIDNGNIDSVVSIDSTLEDGDPAAPWYRETRYEEHLGHGDTLRAPALLFATPDGKSRAFFDSLTHSPRRMFVVPHLAHNEFVSHGGVLAQLARERRGDTSDPSPPLVRASYMFVVETIGRFLAETLRDEDAAARWFASPVLPAETTVLHADPAFDSTATAWLARIEADGAAQAVATCRAQAVCTWPHDLANAAAILAEADHTTAAVVLYEAILAADPDVWTVHAALASLFAETSGRDDDARVHIVRARALLAHDETTDPSDREYYDAMLAGRLRWLDERAQAPSQ